MRNDILLFSEYHTARVKLDDRVLCQTTNSERVCPHYCLNLVSWLVRSDDDAAGAWFLPSRSKKQTRIVLFVEPRLVVFKSLVYGSEWRGVMDFDNEHSLSSPYTACSRKVEIRYGGIGFRLWMKRVP